MILALPMLGLLLAAAPQDAPQVRGFDAHASDPYTAGMFEELVTTSGRRLRVRSQNIDGEANGTAFVNVTRWLDARALRGEAFEIKLAVRLDTTSLNTTARLWARTILTDGSVGYEDLGVDSATSSGEWTTLRTEGAIAREATDLCFGMIVSGPTPVHMEAFELGLLGPVGDTDLRLSIPGRWIEDPDSRTARVNLPESGAELLKIDFAPAGYAADALPHLWVWSQNDLRQDFLSGRALLEAMRQSQEPPAVVSFLRPLGEQGKPATRGAKETFRLMGSEFAKSGTHGFVHQPKGRRLEVLFHAVNGSWSEFQPEADSELVRHLGKDGYLQSERVVLRMLGAHHDAAGDAQLSDLLLQASLASMQEWTPSLAVQQASHDLAGHDCGHDHSHDGHDHSHH